MKKYILSSILAIFSGIALSNNIAAVFSKNHDNIVYQDPAKTAKYPNSDPVVSHDGSGGKYRSSHKHANGHKFAKNKRHIKKAKKSRSDNSEKSRNENTR